MNMELQKGSRSKLLATGLILVMILFVARLFYLQIVQYSYYVDIADKEQIRRLTIPSKRGIIYALDGSVPVPLAMNQTVYTVFADPKVVKDEDKDKIIDTIRKVAGGNARSELDVLLDIKESRYQILATRVTHTQAEKIKQEDLSGIGFQEESMRVYPEGSLAAQVLGFVDVDGIGRYGVEDKLNDRLIGVDGLLQSVTDVRDVPLTIGDNNINKPAIDGENLVLSIDRNIQSKVEQAIKDGLKRTGADKGSAIVMDPQTGQVMAMANFPTYDPANYNKVEDVALFNNAVISTPYEPGSNVKALTMATGIDKGVVGPESTYVNTDRIVVEDRVITNATYGQTGTITFQHAMNWSLNTGFVTIAQLLGDGSSITKQSRDVMYDYFYNRFRLGQPTGIELASEASGIIISPDEVEGNAVRYSNMSFGQGMNVTMVQLAAAFCSIVNGGEYHKPTVLAGVIDKNGSYSPNQTDKPSRTISENTANQVRQMTHIARASSFNSVDKQGYYIGGKTGTAQVIENGAYADDETIGTYLGFGGSEQLSRYVIMVQVSGKDKELQGARDALPIFTDISNWMIDYLKIQPKG